MSQCGYKLVLWYGMVFIETCIAVTYTELHMDVHCILKTRVQFKTVSFTVIISTRIMSHKEKRLKRERERERDREREREERGRGGEREGK